MGWERKAGFSREVFTRTETDIVMGCRRKEGFSREVFSRNGIAPDGSVGHNNYGLKQKKNHSELFSLALPLSL